MMRRKADRNRSGAGGLLLGLCLTALLTMLAPTTAEALTTTTLPANGSTGELPLHIAIDSTGNVYTTNSDSNFVTRITPSGGGAPFNSTGVNPRNLVIDPDGNLLITNCDSNNLTRMIPSGLQTTPFAEAGDCPGGITIGPGGDLFVANAGSNSVSRISMDGSQAGAPWPVPVGEAPQEIAAAPNGSLFTTNYGTNDISRITPAGEVTSSFASVTDPRDLAIDPDGNLFVTSYYGHRVAKVTPAGAVTESFAPTGFLPRGITFDSARNLYVTNVSSNSVTKISPNGEATTPFASVGAQPNDITIDSSGNLYTVNFNARNVTRISPDPGTQEIAPAPPDTPSAPIATPGQNSALVTVPTNPMSARYGAPTSYSVTAVEDPFRTCTVTPPGTSCRVNNLTGGIPYTFTARANLNAWQTPPSSPSSPVTPTNPSIRVSGLKAKVSKKAVVLKSKVKVSAAGKVTQTAKQGRKTWCKSTKVIRKAGVISLSCNLKKKGRKAISKKALKLSVKTTLAPGSGAPVSRTQRVKVKRRT